ncbi:protein prkA [Candidatus Daviesbacteria bacterium]|nr:protein prkA [Candidatus Daviesbacteria bacterium]
MLERKRGDVDIASLLGEAQQTVLTDRALLAEKMSFGEYLEEVSQKPAIASLAHARVYDMIRSAGITPGADGQPNHYAFFRQELFGLDSVFQNLVEDYFAPAARRLDVRKRILMLVGPVGGGKSTAATLIKEGLERYSRTPEGAWYAIDSCPMNEEPLHLIPDSHREAFGKRLGVHIEGDLCPHCQLRLEHDWNGRIGDVMVARRLFSEKSRVGIGTFKPADPKSQDVAELTGHVNLGLLVDQRFGGESDPRVYRFDGELNVANRGVVEFIEMLKLEPRFLYELNTVAGEQRIKVPQFALIYADLTVLAHTNEYEFNKYFSDPANEAMVDRIFVVKMPYNLRVSDEVRIYNKMINAADLSIEDLPGEESGRLRQAHIAPQTLRVASMLAVLSRLSPSAKAGLSLMAKMKLYDGEQKVGDWEQKHLGEIRTEAEAAKEGMDGLSPRFIINRLSSALMKGKRCINPLDALRSLRDGIKSNYASDTKEQERLLTLLDEVRKEYDEGVKKQIQRAFVYAYEESAQTLLDNYIQNVDAFSNKTKVKDPVTGEDVGADEALMASIEQQIGIIGDARKREFREGVMRSVASCALRKQSFTLSSNSVIQEAIEKKLFADLKDMVKITTSTRTPDEEQLKRIDIVVARLTDQSLLEDERHCTQCARELLKYAGQLLNR